MNKDYQHWTKEEVLAYHLKVTPELEPYKHLTEWVWNESGWLPDFKAPDELLQKHVEAMLTSTQ
jgi:hypothetical protein